MKIRFRVWDKTTEHMIRSPYDAPFNIVLILPGGDVDVHEKSKEIKWMYGDYSPNNYRFITMLNTQVKDKNDKDIFEGDIVEIQQHPDIFYTGEVKYVNGCFSINGIMIGTVCNKNLRILGNIYEKED